MGPAAGHGRGGGGMMGVCRRFDPITASCAPCCAVCSRRGSCQEETEKAAPARQHRSGKAEQFSEPVSASYLSRI